jgi:hypothetical protein
MPTVPSASIAPKASRAGLGHGPLRRTLRPQFGRIDAAQPDLGGDVEARPDMDARLEGVAVDYP